MSAILEAGNLTKYFGGVKALNGITLTVNDREVLGLIGPNGSGKTTFLNLISGLVRPTTGEILFAGEKSTFLRPDEITAKGIGRTFQKIRLFRNMSVLKNVSLGQHCRTNTGVLGAVFGGKKGRQDKERVREKALELLGLVGLAHMQEELAKNLPHGQQKTLEIARALASAPTLLLLDEPAAGLNFEERGQLIDLIRQIRDKGISVLLIEHSMEVVMAACDRIAVLHYGKKIFQGIPQEVRRSELVIASYLGEDSGDVAS